MVEGSVGPMVRRRMYDSIFQEENLRREAINEEQKQEVDRLHIARSCW